MIKLPKNLLRAVSKDTTRIFAYGVRIYPDGWVYATDGARMHGVRFPDAAFDTGAIRVRENLKRQTLDLAGFPDVRIAIPNNDDGSRHHAIHRDAFLAAVRKVEAHHKALAQERGALALEADALKRTMFPNKAAAARVRAGDRHTELVGRLATLAPSLTLMSIVNDDGGHVIRVGAPDPAFDPVYVPAPFSARVPFPVVLPPAIYDPRYIREALDMFPKGSVVTVRAPEDDRTPLLFTAPDVMALVMPMRS